MRTKKNDQNLRAQLLLSWCHESSLRASLAPHRVPEAVLCLGTVWARAGARFTICNDPRLTTCEMRVFLPHSNMGSCARISAPRSPGFQYPFCIFYFELRRIAHEEGRKTGAGEPGSTTDSSFFPPAEIMERAKFARVDTLAAALSCPLCFEVRRAEKRT